MRADDRQSPAGSTVRVEEGGSAGITSATLATTIVAGSTITTGTRLGGRVNEKAIEDLSPRGAGRKGMVWRFMVRLRTLFGQWRKQQETKRRIGRRAWPTFPRC